MALSVFIAYLLYDEVAIEIISNANTVGNTSFFVSFTVAGT